LEKQVISGKVNARAEAVIPISILASDGIAIEVNAILDTGFTGSLTLPDALIASLGLSRRAGSTANLADGSSKSFGVYAAQVEWDGSLREVLVFAMGGEGLLGMRLLDGYDLRIEIRDGGVVELKKL
jgi:clan AA aspartic protease